MTWIRTIAFNDATGKLNELYERINGPDNNVDNIMMAHGLRPHTMEGHMAIYRNVIHHPRNSLPNRASLHKATSSGSHRVTAKI